ncbi:MAG: hypothetical protein EXR60_04570 [Dehalococcoidia bacterium]|nr:hypothetical protein [Dehalococcoidia bacterium]
MLKLTDRAAILIQRVLDELGALPSEALRITSRAGDDLEYDIDAQRPGDMVVEREGLKLLVVGHLLGQSLERSTIDAQEGPQGVRLLLIP